MEEDLLDLNIDLKEFDHSQSVHDSDTKIKAVILYQQTGSMSEVARTLGVKHNTIKSWKHRSPWWNQVVQVLKERKQDELDDAITKAIHSSVEAVTDRIENGDWFIDRSGDLRRVPMKGRDIATTLSTLYDKRSLIRGDLPNIKEAAKQDALKQLEAKFTEFAKDLKEKDIVSEQSSYAESYGEKVKKKSLEEGIKG